jgi:hypothetical protein
VILSSIRPRCVSPQIAGLFCQQPSRYCIPLGTLRDWEQGRSEPDRALSAYLRAIAAMPEAVQNVLEPVSKGFEEQGD